MRKSLATPKAIPQADVDGYDARAKLCILSRIALHAELDPDSVTTQSIADIDAIDFAYAKELNCTIRAGLKRSAEGPVVHARVAPMLVPLASPMAWSHGTQNMVIASGRFGGDVVFSATGQAENHRRSCGFRSARPSRRARKPCIFPCADAPSRGSSWPRTTSASSLTTSRASSPPSPAPSPRWREHRLAASASGLSETPPPFRRHHGALPDLNYFEGARVHWKDGLHVGASAVFADARPEDKP